MLLMQDPELLLVDEPAAGMTDDETEQTAALLRRIAGDHSVVVVEHDMEFVRALGSQASPCCTRARCWPRARSTTCRTTRGSSKCIWGADDARASTPSICSTAPAMRCAACRLRPRKGAGHLRARAATASARPACCARSSASSRPAPAGSSGKGRTSRGCRPTSARARGIGFVPQGREIFPLLTVEENLQDRLRRRCRAALRIDPGRDLRPVPGAQVDAGPPRRRSLGRPAAAARDRPRAGHAAAPAACSTSRPRASSPRSSRTSSGSSGCWPRAATWRSCWSSSISSSPATSPTNYAVMDRGEIVLSAPAGALDEAEVRRHLTV